MKRYIISFLSIILIFGMVASASSVSVTIYGTNKSNTQSNVTCYGCNNTISIQAWNTSYVKNFTVHTVNASGDVVSFNISNITAYQVQELKVNGTAINGYQAGANGMLNFTYTVTGNKTFTLSPAVKVNGYNMTWGWFDKALPASALPANVITSANNSQYANGTYTGDGSQNRAIPHGLGRRPNIIILQEEILGTPNIFFNIDGNHWYDVLSDAPRAVTKADATNFYVGIATPFNTNISPRLYNWTAS